MTPADLRKRAAELDAEGEAYLDAGDRSRALDCFARAELRRQLAAEMEGARVDASRLKSRNKARTISRNMAHAESAAAQRRRGRPAVSDHPFPRALEGAGSSVAEWARKHGVDRSVAKSWYAPPPGGRRIPARMAKAIEREFGVPATEEVWTNGIKD